jgi:hypothetical protein
MADPAAIEKILRTGADKARVPAAATLKRARDAMGLLPRD